MTLRKFFNINKKRIRKLKPIKPKYENLVKLEVQVTDKTKETLSRYSKFNKYTEGEIINILIEEILQDDKDFNEWLTKQRYNKTIKKNILIEPKIEDISIKETDWLTNDDSAAREDAIDIEERKKDRKSGQ